MTQLGSEPACLPEFHIHEDRCINVRVLPAAALGADLDLLPKEEGISKGQRPALGLACPSLPHFSALFLPVVVAEILSRKLF